MANNIKKCYMHLLNALLEHGESDACLEWPFNRIAEGYGQVWDGEKNRRVHIVTYAVVNGLKLPLPFIVRHKCDNPACFNPKHLEPGTHQDNVNDAIERGRRHKRTFPYESQCRRCGTTFKPRSATNYYCSRVCYMNGERGPHGTYKSTQITDSN